MLLLLLAGSGVNASGEGSATGGKTESNVAICACATAGVICPWVFQKMAISVWFGGLGDILDKGERNCLLQGFWI
jgi:hypothetical protein